jgi:ferredoxin
LREDRTLRHDEGACLPLRSRHGQCRACESACPVQALEVGIEAVTLGSACIGCGRCTAACPSGALGLPELESQSIEAWAVPAVPAHASPQASAGGASQRPANLRIECRMVPAAARSAPCVELPCLGALSPGRIASYVAAGRQVTVVDRGWCEGCAAGGAPGAAVPQGIAAAREAVRLARSWLGALDLDRSIAAGAPVADPDPLRARISIALEALPVHLRPTELPPAPAEGSPVDRRRFFRAALERPAGRERKPEPMGGNGRAAYPASERAASPERQRLHAALSRLGESRGQPVPAEFYPALHANTRCADSRMCVALCPTAALSVAEEGTAAQLRFDPLRCIACGTCTRACPEGALSLSPYGGAEDASRAAETKVLATHLQRPCTECGTPFAARADESAARPSAALCPTCTKSRRFMADARTRLFGASH